LLATADGSTLSSNTIQCVRATFRPNEAGEFHRGYSNNSDGDLPCREAVRETDVHREEACWVGPAEPGVALYQAENSKNHQHSIDRGLGVLAQFDSDQSYVIISGFDIREFELQRNGGLLLSQCLVTEV
jgi:hypothetical protein